MDLAEEASVGVAQLIDHHRDSEERRSALFDQALRRQRLAALLHPVIDQQDSIVHLERALLNLQPMNESAVVRCGWLGVLRARE